MQATTLRDQRLSDVQGQPWALEADAVLADQRVDPHPGLSDAEAARRLREHGPNELRAAPTTSRWSVLARQLRSAVVLLLFGAAVLSLAVGELLEGGAILAAIGISIALGFFTELRAVRSMEALRKLGVARARVRRGGKQIELPATALVPGDVVELEAGDRVQADLRVIEASKLQADESTLTGESVPVGKNQAPVDPGAPLADRKSMLYQGSAITRGSGAAVVVATGMRTELGRIASLLDEAHTETTPLEQRLATLGGRLLWVCLGIALLTSVGGIVAGRAVMLMIETGVALAVASIPEGLPIVATIALAKGMRRLAHRHALIKRLSAVETLGATSVIVLDKTGTLTENRMEVAALVVNGRDREISIAEARDDEGAMRALVLGALCSNASIEGDAPAGDPLEVALLRAAATAGIRRPALVAELPEVFEEAFDPSTKMMATVHRTASGFLVAVKGAPEVVLAASDVDLDDRHMWLERSSKMASRGVRVLGVAEKDAASESTDVYDGLRFVGLVGLADPPREDVRRPVAACRAAGMRLIMATGDQPATAGAIARAVGLADADDLDIVNGADLVPPAELSDSERARLLNAHVFARVTPEQKLDLIELHQRTGAIVAMTGDGVNDAPALRKADIGIAMGERGTDVAREAAEMVLVDDSFESIVVAIGLGRAIFENIRRFVVYLLSCNASEILVVSGAVLAGAALPLLPLQILFLNFVTDVFPALALGFGAGDPSAMTRPPRRADEPIIGRRQWLAIFVYGATLTAAVLTAMFLAYRVGADDAEARTVSFLTMALGQLWHVFNMRQPGTRLLENDVVTSRWVWGAIGLCLVILATVVLVPSLAAVLHIRPLSLEMWAIVAAMGLVPTLLGQLRLLFATLWMEKAND